MEQKHRITESVIKLGRSLWMSSASTSSLKQGHLHLLARTTSKWFLNISKDGDSSTALGKLCQCWVTLTGEKRSSEGTSCLSVSAHCLQFHSLPSTIPAFLFHLGHLSWRYELACLVLWHIPRHLHVIH